ncbi:hypothetical protein P9112_012865 [Eukaryota sp. TZLM1-RC]
MVYQFGDLAPIVTLNDIPRQTNGYDCGVFVCWCDAMAKQVYKSNDHHLDLVNFIDLLYGSGLNVAEFRMNLEILDIQLCTDGEIKEARTANFEQYLQSGTRLDSQPRKRKSTAKSTPPSKIVRQEPCSLIEKRGKIT